MQVERLDHLVLTVKDPAATCDFYQKALGMKPVAFADNRKALVFASGKINLHAAGNEFKPNALRPTPGSADLCFITKTPLTAVVEHLRIHSIPIIEGPTPKTGAFGPLVSIYFRDPDGNLVEVSNQE